MTRVIAAVTAANLVLTLLVTIVVVRGIHGGPPVQQQGTAAGRPHRVPASATMAHLVNGRVVLDGKAARRAGGGQLPPSRRPHGTVPAAVSPPRVELPARGTAHETLHSARQPKAPAVAGFNAKTSRLQPGASTATSVTYRNADGTRTALIYQSPVNWRRPDGTWVPIDTTLVPGNGAASAAAPSPTSPASAPLTARPTSPSPQPTPLVSSPSPQPSRSALPVSPEPSPAASPTAAPAGGWHERSAGLSPVFAPYADASPLVTLPLGGSRSVGFALAGAGHAAGVTQGSTVTYPGVARDADLRFIAGSSGVKEQLVLRSPAAAASWVFPLQLNGLQARQGSDGAIVFTGSDGKAAAVVPHGVMSDSAIDPHSGNGAMSTAVRYTLTTSGGRPAIRMDLGASWLASKSRVYPVIVDPSVQPFNSNGTTYVEYPYTNDYSGDQEIDVGTWDGGSNIARSFLKFDSVSSNLQNENVLGARLSLFNSWSYSCSPRTVWVSPVTSSWSVSGNKSWPGPSIGGPVASRTFATGWVPLGSTSSPCPGSWQPFNLGTGGNWLLNGWTHGTIANNGLALTASNADSYGWKKFTSINNPTGDPHLSVTYTPYGATYALASSNPVKQVQQNQNGQLAIRVKNTGHDTWTPSNGYELSYRAYNSKGQKVADHPVFTPMPHNVAPGQSVTVDANVNALPAGQEYAINFDMYASANTSSPVSFSSQGVQPFAVGLYIPDPPPVVNSVYPPSGYIAPVATPQLSTSAFSTIGKTLSYTFTLTCQPLPGTSCGQNTISSGTLSKPYWTVSPAMSWDEPYTWTVVATDGTSSTTVGPVSITPEVPQPGITSHLSPGNGQAFDPQTGDYTTSATDAAVAVAGPPLKIDRSYNSADPRTSGAFGAGWSALADTTVTPDSDGSGNVVVSMPDGQQMRFAPNAGSSTYAGPFGSPDVLIHNSGGSWTLEDSSSYIYDFTSGGKISEIINPEGFAQQFTLNSAGEVTTITDATSGRALHLAWSTPSGAGSPHVASVATDPPASGQSGYTWTYSYTGDLLTGACAPGGNCTSYSYTTGSHFRSQVLDAGPRAYWRFDDPAGSATAADQVDANLDSATGTYANVTLGQPGPLAGSSETAAGFDGTSSQVTLPDDLISDGTDVTIGLWFKAASTTASGVLLGYQADLLNNTNGPNDPHVPALYVGGDGKLRGEFWNGSTAPITSTGSVDDGGWHYAVLTASASSQSLYLDGQLVGSKSGQIDQGTMVHNTAGAGFWAGWPAAYVNQGPSAINTNVGYFNGSIAEAAVYPHALGQPAVTAQYTAASGTLSELSQVTLPSGRVFQQAAYDTVGDRVSSYTDPNGGQWVIHLPAATGYKATSESLGEVTDDVTVQDPAGRDEVYGYDELNGGRLVSYDRGAGNAPRTFGYDSAGYLNQITDEDGNLVSLTNDAHGNVLSRTWFPSQPATSASPAVAGPMSPAATSSSCCTAYYSYYFNNANPLDPKDNKVTAVRDARSASATDSTYLTSYGYNTAGQLTQSTTPATSDFPSGRTTQYFYAQASSPTAAYGGGTVPAGLLLSTHTPGGAVTSYSYYANGDLAQVTTPDGQRTVYTYDALGRPETSTAYSDTYPSGLVTSYSYNALGQPVTVTSPGVHNQVTGVVHTKQDAYSYDSDGNLLQKTESDTTGGDAARTTSYTYDDHGHVATVTDPAGGTTGYNYDASGNPADVIDANGNERLYTYNEYNEITQITLHTASTDQSNPDGSSDLVLESDAYDPAGLLSAKTDAMGRITSYFYDHNQDLIATQQQPPPASSGQAPPPGRQTAYTYDPAGNLVSTDVSDLPVANQTVTNYTVDAADRITSQVVDPVPSGSSSSGYVNRTTNYTYNADGYLTSKTAVDGSLSQATSYGYDAEGNLTSQSVQDGSASLVTTWTRDQRGLPTSMTDPRGNASGANPASYTTSYSYDEAGQLSAQTGPPVTTQAYGQSAATTRPVTSYGYDTFGDQAQQTDPDSNTTTTSYDGDGRVTSVTQPAYTPPGTTTAITATTSYTYDGLGNRTSQTDPAGNKTTYTYDTLGDVLTQTDPQVTGQSAPGQWIYSYDNDGEQLTATGPTGAETQATYDYFGDQATATQDIRGGTSTTYNTTNYSYDYLGDRTQETSPDNVVTNYSYDHVGELTGVTDAYSNTTGYSYNYLGQLAQVTRPDGTATTYGYDGAGNLTSQTDYGIATPPANPPVLRSQSFGYDGAGNQTSFTDGRQHTTTFSYDAGNHLTQQVQPVTSSSSNTTGFSYDPAGNQTSVTDGRGNTTWTTYNSWNLPQSVIEPATSTDASDRTWTVSYDADARRTSVAEPGGVTVTSSYDQLGDLTGQTGSGADATTTPRSFGYDLAGRMTSASAPGGTDTFAYNDAGQVTATGGPSGTASFGYNGDQQMTSRADAAGTTSYTYDKAGRLATLADPASGAQLSYTYNANSQVSQISYGSGNDTQTFGYDGLGQLTSDTLTGPSGQTVATASYGYDANGNETSQTTSGLAGPASNTYGYDEANRLTSWNNGSGTTSYGYDASGNRTQIGGYTVSYDARDELTSIQLSSNPPSTLTYTPRGTIASFTGGYGTSTYTTDAFGDAITTAGQTYSYDALGRLTGDAGSSGSRSLSYSGTGDQIAADGTATYTYDPTGSLIGTGAPSGGQGTLDLTNNHTDVTGIFTPAATALTGSQAYDPLGNITATTGANGLAGNLGYQSDFTDSANSLVDMGARWYQPGLGIFTSNDTLNGTPAPYTITPEPYGYAGDNPLTTTDPTGHCWWVTCAVTGLLSAAGRAVPTLGGRAAVGAGILAFWPEILTVGAATAGWTGLMWAFAPGVSCSDSLCAPSYTSPDHLWGADQLGDSAGGYWYGYPCPSCSLDLPIISPGVGPGPNGNPCYGICGPPPPPPPPPQDIYAGPNAAAAPPVPSWMLHKPYIAKPVSDTKNPRLIPRRNQVTERAQPSNKPVKGAKSTDNENGAQQPGEGGKASPSDAIRLTGLPAAPEADTPATAGNAVGGGTGNPPPAPPTACVPEPQEPNPNPNPNPNPSGRQPRGGVYTLREPPEPGADPGTGKVVRTGKTNDLARRPGELRGEKVLRHYEFNIEYRTDDPDVQLGLELMLYNRYPEARVENGGLNKKKPPVHGDDEFYLQKAEDFLRGQCD